MLLTLHLDSPVLAVAVVATCDPSFGNGIHFTKMLPEDEEVLRAYLKAHEDAEVKSEKKSSESPEP